MLREKTSLWLGTPRKEGSDLPSFSFELACISFAKKHLFYQVLFYATNDLSSNSKSDHFRLLARVMCPLIGWVGDRVKKRAERERNRMRVTRKEKNRKEMSLNRRKLSHHFQKICLLYYVPGESRFVLGVAKILSPPKDCYTFTYLLSYSNSST